MRRWAASFLLLLTVLLPLQPLLANAQLEANLPACCRRNGIHHCVMPRSMIAALALASSAHPSFNPPPCPWKLAIVPAVVATAGSSCKLASQPVTVAQVVVAHSILFFNDRTQLQSTRAPPVALL